MERSPGAKICIGESRMLGCRVPVTSGGNVLNDNVTVGIAFSFVGDDDGILEMVVAGVEVVFVSVGMISLVGEVSAVGLCVIIDGSTYLVSCVALGGEGVRSSC